MAVKKLFTLFNIKNALVVIFILSIFFSNAINNISFFILLGISIFEIAKKKKIEFNKLYFFLVFVFLYLILEIVLFGDFTEDSQIILRYLLLAVFPLLFYADKHFLSSFKKCYLIAYSVFLVVIFYGVILNYINFQEFNFYTTGKNIKNFLYIERLYFGLSSMIAGVFIIDVFKEKIKIKYVLLSLVFLANFLISSRLSTLFLIFLIFIQCFKNFNLKLSYKNILAFIGILVIGFFFISKNKGIKERLFLNVSNLDEFIEEVKIKEPRFAIWRCVANLKNKEEFNSLIGYKTDLQIENDLIKCYSETIYIKDKREWFVKNKYNSHNQFFYIYLLHGAIALILFILFLLVAPFINKSSSVTFFSIIVISFLFIENPFFRQIGVYLIGICLSLLCYPDKKKSYV
ncbi:hypothetical protein SAMN04488096_103252 [Mesonia phycicola]|uniref:O-Antigen ligase n=1 Tax=Mesonia phycicola TaxID=579105 RepID=A0A1M6D1U9_9FLAO|nr:hypothetical protein [Mesonia phycicola]SHI66968.1 hypothetical protein SAMN04488096_103252 [Mesonia phycicola]